jgi:DNA polymerase-3 subunit delta'
MTSFNELFGQTRPIKILQSILQTGNVPNALLFVGEDGIGKKSAAMIFIQALCCEAPASIGISGPQAAHRLVGPLEEGALIHPCNACLSCQKIQSGNHPDFLIVAPEKDENSIKIDAVRAMQDTIMFTPMEAKWKVVLIAKAEALTIQAQNSLLKTLEEAPPYVVLILIAAKSLLLAPTLLSRCQKVPFSSLSLSQIEAILVEKKQWTTDDARLVAAFTGGKLGEALSFEIEAARAQEALLNDLVKEETLSHYDTLFEMAKTHAGNLEMMEHALYYLSAYFRDILVILMMGAQPDSAILVFSWRKEELMRWANRMNAEEVIKFLANIAAIEQTLSRNINKQLALETLLMQMRDKLS